MPRRYLTAILRSIANQSGIQHKRKTLTGGEFTLFFKRISDSLLKLFDRILNAFFSLSAGLLTAQFPQFLAQYLQRLGGHIDEAHHIAEEFQLPALAERAATLAAGLDAINKASPFLRLPVFIANSHWDIARKAYENFTPGMTFTAEELCYLAGGALLGLFIYSGIKSFCRGIWLILRKIRLRLGKKRYTTV